MPRSFVCRRCEAETVRTSNSQKYCSDCREHANKEKEDVWRDANRDHLLSEKIRWNSENEDLIRSRRKSLRREFPDEVRQRERELYRQNAESRRESARKYSLANREKIAERARSPEAQDRSRQYMRNRRADPSHRLHSNVSCLIRNSIRGKGGRSWETLVGYTNEDLMAHIGKQFSKGMTWDNYGKWHIDHIVPRASFSFDAVDDPEFKACWALTNLMPLWGSDNMSKGSRRLHLI